MLNIIKKLEKSNFFFIFVVPNPKQKLLKKCSGLGTKIKYLEYGEKI